MRFLHTADWQIGMQAAHVGAVAEKVRAARIDAARHVLALCRQRQVDFMVLAGDTFEHNALSYDLIQSVAHLLAQAPCPVLVLPGNHDLLEPGSVWHRPLWKEAGPVSILSERTPVHVKGVEILPCPVTAKTSTQNPTAWIQPGDKDRIRVVVAHGCLQTSSFGSDDHPIPLDTPARTQADYVALGHWHSTTIYNQRMAYSGTHEPTKFGEPDSGNVLLVEIDRPGDEPRIEPLATGQLRWLRLGTDAPVSAPGELAQLASRLRAIADPSRTLLELKLSGVLFQQDHKHLSAIKACEGFLLSRVDDSGLKPEPHGDDWMRGLPPGPVRETASRLKQRSAQPGREGEIATQALLQLFHYAQEAESC
jgi:predicted phosphodiesterase